MTFELSLSLALAHSAVYFSRSEQWPFDGPEPRNDGKDTASTTEQETNEQVALQGNNDLAAGAGSAAAGQQGSVFSRGSIGQVSGRGNTAITTIETSDPAVTTAALATTANVADTSLEANDTLATAAINAGVTDTQSAIAAGVADTQENATFGEDALEAAANANANATTALEGISSESQQTASNALAAAQNETLAGVTPAQEFQTVSPTTPGTVTASSNVATWLTIIIGVVTLVYFVKKGKLS